MTVTCRVPICTRRPGSGRLERPRRRAVSSSARPASSSHTFALRPSALPMDERESSARDCSVASATLTAAEATRGRKPLCAAGGEPPCRAGEPSPDLGAGLSPLQRRAKSSRSVPGAGGSDISRGDARLAARLGGRSGASACGATWGPSPVPVAVASGARHASTLGPESDGRSRGVPAPSSAPERPAPARGASPASTTRALWLVGPS